jgi:quercetin dioxygenase-like cupin family protein
MGNPQVGDCVGKILGKVVASGAVAPLVQGAMAQTPADPAALHWTVPDVLPPGALIAVVSGNPAGPGESTLQLSMPDGYRIPPHFHPSYGHVEVREGTLLVGMGDSWTLSTPGPWPPAIRPLPRVDAPFLDRQRADRAVP